MQRAIIATLALAAAFTWQASAETTTMQVPQGSGTFPTIGQVECLEEMGSGRYCAATYECGNGSSGDLWGDMANHNGRRTIGADSAVANQLDCVVSVDGKAAVQWFHGHRPTGREGNVVGLSPVVSAEPPTITRNVRVTGGDDLWLLWYIRTRNIGDFRATLRERNCGHIKEGTDELNSCHKNVDYYYAYTMGLNANWLLTPVTTCVTEMADLYQDEGLPPTERLDHIGHVMAVLDTSDGGYGLLGLMRDVVRNNATNRARHWRTREDAVGEKYRECRELHKEQLVEFGLADPEE